MKSFAMNALTKLYFQLLNIAFSS